MLWLECHEMKSMEGGLVIQGNLSEPFSEKEQHEMGVLGHFASETHDPVLHLRGKGSGPLAFQWRQQAEAETIDHPSTRADGGGMLKKLHHRGMPYVTSLPLRGTPATPEMCSANTMPSSEATSCKINGRQ